MTTYPRLPVLVGLDEANESLEAVRLAAIEARLRRLPLGPGVGISAGTAGSAGRCGVAAAG